tara:strand:- start:2409 stop:2612 length:204 start_codon:yes stop_codon:yes gene_type:complete
MTLTTEQLNELKYNYAEMIVDDMDIQTLCQLAVEMIEKNMKDYDEDDVIAEIIDLYGEETASSLMPL